MRVMKCIIVSLLFILPVCHLTAQTNPHVKTVRKYLREGNKLFRDGHRDDAFTFYKKAYDIDSTNARVVYNLATSLLPADYWRPWPKIEEAAADSLRAQVDSLYHLSADYESNHIVSAMSHYNTGVMYQSLSQSKGDDEQQTNLRKAIDSYKDALRKNPSDNEARYNLVVCMKQLRKNQQQQQQQQQNNNENKEDDHNQDKQQNDSTQQQPQQQPQQQQQQPQQQQQQPQNMEQQKMDQMLRNAMQKEREVQQRMKEVNKEGMPARRPNRKNW